MLKKAVSFVLGLETILNVPAGKSRSRGSGMGG
jgi:hypothetical protein